MGLTPEPAATASAPQAVSEQAVWGVLKTCFDPEIPVNIVDLGLIYDLALEPLPAGGHKAFVKMTLTAPGCGMGPTIAADDRPSSAIAEAMQPPTVQTCRLPRDFGNSAPMMGTSAMPISVPPCCMLDSLVVSPGVRLG